MGNTGTTTNAHVTATRDIPCGQVLAPSRTAIVYYNADTHTHWQQQQHNLEDEEPQLIMMQGQGQGKGHGQHNTAPATMQSLGLSLDTGGEHGGIL